MPYTGLDFVTTVVSFVNQIRLGEEVDINRLLLSSLCLMILASCGPPAKFFTTQTARAEDTIAASWTATPRYTSTPTKTLTPTITSTFTPHPTFPPTPTWPAVVTVSPNLLQYCKEDTYARLRVAERKQLALLSSCEMASGTIVRNPDIGEHDGDYTFNLRLDPGQERFVTTGNYEKISGNLHIEIEPPEQETFPALPVKGMHIVVVGVWARDKPINWNEIHPVWFWAEVTP